LGKDWYVMMFGIVRKTMAGGPLEEFNGKGWWQHFMECWPDLALRKGDALA